MLCMTSVIFANADDPRPAVQAFVRNYKQRYGRDPNFAAQIGYTAANTLIQGLQNAGRTLTVDSLVAGMEQIKGLQDIFGSPPMTFGPDQRLGSNMSYIAVVKGGKWALGEPNPVGY